MAKYWFRQSEYGYGPGFPPISWEGWLVLPVYFAVLLGGVTIAIPHWLNPVVGILLVILPLGWTTLLIWICWRTTEGGWVWRWGGDP